MKVIIIGESTGWEGKGGFKATLSWIDITGSQRSISVYNKTWAEARRLVIEAFKSTPKDEEIDL